MLTRHPFSPIKKSISTAFMLLSAGYLSSVACADIGIAENVCIDFGESNVYDSASGWNVQEGETEGWGFLVTGGDRVTTDLTDKQTGNKSDIKVTFGHATGLNVGNSTPATGSSTLTAPSEEMQDVWKLMHDVTLSAEEINSYWTEVVVLGLGVSVGDITVENLKANSTYAISAAITSAKVLTLVGQAAPLDIKDNTSVNNLVTFITSNDGSVNLELAVGNAGIAGLISGSTFTLTWIFETGASPASVDFSFGGDLLALGEGASISAMAVTRYDEVGTGSVASHFEDGANMLTPNVSGGDNATPEPGSTMLSLLSLAVLAARRRRK